MVACNSRDQKLINDVGQEDHRYYRPIRKEWIIWEYKTSEYVHAVGEVRPFYSIIFANCHNYSPFSFHYTRYHDNTMCVYTVDMFVTYVMSTASSSIRILGNTATSYNMHSYASLLQ